MRRPRIEKVVINISVGKPGEPLEKATSILKELTGQEPSIRRAKETIKDFGIRRGEPIACMVSLRKQRALEVLTKGLEALGNKLPEAKFSHQGSLAFGIREHIEIPGTVYKPELGIVGMDFSVHLARPGYRVKTRKRARSKVGRAQRVTREEAMEFMRNQFGVQVVGREAA